MKRLIAGITLLLLVGCKTTSEKPPRPLGRVLALQQKVDGRWAFYLVHLDDGRKRLVRTGGAAAPDWAPDGQRFAYFDGTRLRIARPDVEEDEELPGGAGFAPAWSPDGKQIAFGTSIAIQSVDLAGGTAKTWYIAHVKVERPTWSPDGNRICAVDANDEIIVTDGKAPRHYPARGSRNPDWSADGRIILLEGADGTIQALDPETGEMGPHGSARGSDPSWLKSGGFLTVWKAPGDEFPCVYEWDAAGLSGSRITTQDEARNADGNW